MFLICTITSGDWTFPGIDARMVVLPKQVLQIFYTCPHLKNPFTLATKARLDAGTNRVVFERSTRVMSEKKGEKNWIPFIYSTKLYLIHSINSWRILEICAVSGEDVEKSEKEYNRINETRDSIKGPGDWVIYLGYTLNFLSNEE